jgi:hypothetical protein
MHEGELQGDEKMGILIDIKKIIFNVLILLDEDTDFSCIGLPHT